MRKLWNSLRRWEKIFLVISPILAAPIVAGVIYGIYLDFQPPPPLSPMQKQTERYAHNFGFPWQNVYVDAVEISDWCYHEKVAPAQYNFYYYEVVTDDQTRFLIEVNRPLSVYKNICNGEPYRLIGDTTKIQDRVFKGVAELKGTTIDELRELYGCRCLFVYQDEIEKLPAA